MSPHEPTPPAPTPRTPRERRVVPNIALRRAVMRVLLRAEQPITVGEIVRHLEDVDGIDVASARTATASQRISNLLGWQCRCGRVERVAHATYAAIPGAIPRTTRWRIEHWDRLDSAGVDDLSA